MFDKIAKQKVEQSTAKNIKTDEFDILKSKLLEVESRNGDISKRKDLISSERDLVSQLSKTNQ